MTFDEVIEKSRVLSMDGTQQIYSDDVIQLINELRQEYAPTVEMAEGQAKTILDPEQGEKLTALLADGVPNFDYLFWEPLTEKQVAQAWLHPETIKVIGEENDT